jgi:hypothetical protein
MMAKLSRLCENTLLTTRARRHEESGGLSCLCVLIVLGSMLMGCGRSGEKPQPVSGRVTFQGKAVAAGMIRFSNPQAAIDIMANLRPDGAYEVLMARGAGLPTGTYQVAVMPPMVERPIGMGQAPKPPVCADIPAKYRQPSTSGLTLTVKPGRNVLDVDMQP